MHAVRRTFLALCLLTAGCTATSASDAGVRDLGAPDLGPDLALRDLGPPDLSLADLTACAVPSRDVSACRGDGSVGVPMVAPCDGMTWRMCANADSPGGCYASHARCVPAPTEDGGFGTGSLCVAASTDVGWLADQRCGDEPACPRGEACVADRPGGQPYCACQLTGAESAMDAGAPDPTCAAVTGDASSCPGRAPAFIGVGARLCDESFRAQCMRWASIESAGCTRAVASCTNALLGTMAGPRIECVRADHCDDAGVDSCGCGASAPCNDGQVCVVDTNGVARCHCAATPTP